MLKARIITALCLIPLVLLALFLPQNFFTAAILAVILAAAWEYTRLINMLHLHGRILFTAVIAASFLLALFFPLPLLTVGTLWWLLATIMLIKFPFGQHYWSRSLFLRAAIGWLMLVPCGVGLTVLHDRAQGAGWVLLLLLMIWAADTGAYFAGRLWGKKLLAPLVSPKKTLEGLYGGLFTTVLAVVIVACFWQQPFFKTPSFMITVIGVFALCVIGDLAESAIKRWMNVKDSGTLLPGHGGLLDRIDSLLAAAPAFALSVLLFSH